MASPGVCRERGRAAPSTTAGDGRHRVVTWCRPFFVTPALDRPLLDPHLAAVAISAAGPGAADRAGTHTADSQRTTIATVVVSPVNVESSGNRTPPANGQALIVDVGADRGIRAPI